MPRRPSRETLVANLRELAVYRPAEDLLHAPAETGSRVIQLPPSAVNAHLPSGVELAFVTEGELQVVTGRGLFSLTPGKLLVLERRVLHAEMYPVPDRGHTAFWCHVDKTHAHLMEVRSEPPLLYAPVGRVVTGRTNTESIAEAVGHELASRDLDYEHAVAALLTYLSCILTRRLCRAETTGRRRSESPSVDGDPHRGAIVRAALEFCESNYHRGVTASDVARAVGYSSAHVSRLVSAYLGRSLASHLRGLRIAASKELLAGSERPVREIARAVGYEDPAHFTRAFAHATGLSPKVFRRRLGVP